MSGRAGKPMHDVIVVGGGPVGLATALYGARAGLDVVVYEARSGPVDKACGEGLMPGAVARLHALGVKPDGRPFAGIAYVDGTNRAEGRFRHGPGLGVRRTTLHSALASAAEDAGVLVVTDRAEAPTLDGDSVQVGARRARYLVAADGLHSPIRRRLGLDRPSPAAHRWGLRRHYRVAPWTDLVEVHWPARGTDERTEAYVTPIGEDLVGVAVLSEQQGSFDDHLAAFPMLLDRLGPARFGSTLGAGPLRQRSRSRVDRRVLLVGDAAGYVDALTGEGIAVGLASAQALIACIAAGRIEDYERQWRRTSRRYRALTSGLLWSRRQPRLARVIVPAAVRYPRLFRVAVDQLAR
jgi:flavin-dependent dehydrogenase